MLNNFGWRSRGRDLLLNNIALLLQRLDVLGVIFGSHGHSRRGAGVDGEVAVHSARL